MVGTYGSRRLNFCGLGYKIVTQRLGAHKAKVSMDKSKAARVVQGLFITPPIRVDRNFSDVGDFPVFNMEELGAALRSLRDKPAPGPDGIPA